MEYYLEIQGNVEEQTDALALTLFSSYRTEKDKTVVKAHLEHTSYEKTLIKLYSEIGEIIHSEIL